MYKNEYDDETVILNSELSFFHSHCSYQIKLSIKVNSSIKYTHIFYNKHIYFSHFVICAELITSYKRDYWESVNNQSSVTYTNFSLKHFHKQINDIYLFSTSSSHTHISVTVILTASVLISVTFLMLIFMITSTLMMLFNSHSIFLIDFQSFLAVSLTQCKLKTFLTELTQIEVTSI